jgi:hypothetical protein
MKPEFFRIFSEKIDQISKFMKILPEGAVLFHADRQTDGHTNMKKLMVALRSQLMLYREINAVCSEIHTKHINTVCGQNVELCLKTQSVPRSKHTPSRLYKPVS